MSSLCSNHQLSGIMVYVSNAIDSSGESNPSRKICNVRAMLLNHIADGIGCTCFGSCGTRYDVA